MTRHLAVSDLAGLKRIVAGFKLLQKLIAHGTVEQDDHHRPETGDDEEQHAVHTADY